MVLQYAPTGADPTCDNVFTSSAVGGFDPFMQWGGVWAQTTAAQQHGRPQCSARAASDPIPQGDNDIYFSLFSWFHF